LIKKKDKIVGYKWDTLTKHVSHRIIVFVLPMLNTIVKIGGEYIAKDCAHLEKQGCMPKGGPKSILGKINKHVGEGNQKMFQMKMSFHVLAHGSLMF
jgi:hypothetical protein